MKIVMVLTSHDQLGNSGRKTGFWLEEFAAPYFVFRDAGVELTLASPKGGQPPHDPKSDLPENQTPAMTRFKQDAAAQKALANTVKLADVKAEDYDTVFYPGGTAQCGTSRRALYPSPFSNLSTIPASQSLCFAIRLGCFAMLHTWALRL